MRHDIIDLLRWIKKSDCGPPLSYTLDNGTHPPPCNLLAVFLSVLKRPRNLIYVISPHIHPTVELRWPKLTAANSKLTDSQKLNQTRRISQTEVSHCAVAAFKAYFIFNFPHWDTTQAVWSLPGETLFLVLQDKILFPVTGLTADDVQIMWRLWPWRSVCLLPRIHKTTAWMSLHLDKGEAWMKESICVKGRFISWHVGHNVLIFVSVAVSRNWFWHFIQVFSGSLNSPNSWKVVLFLWW